MEITRLTSSVLRGNQHEAPQDTPDILPSASATYAKKIASLTKALNRKEERQETPHPRTLSERQYEPITSLARAVKPGVGEQSEDGREVARARWSRI